MVEAAEAVAVAGPYPTRIAAEDAGEAIYRGVKHIPFLYDECFHTVVEIPDHRQGVDATIRKLIDDRGDEE